MIMPAIGGEKIASRLEGSGQEAAAERAVGDQADPELPQDREDRPLRVAGPERILHLHGAERVHGMGAADGLRTRLAQAQVADLALLDEPRHRPDGVLDRHVGVDPVLVVEVDPVDLQPLQAPLESDGHVFGPAVRPPPLPARAADIAELAREGDLLAAALQRACDQLLVCSGTIGVGGVEAR
jgi:hypothetical protein